MTKREESDFEMIGSVITHLEDNTELISSTPAVITNIALLKGVQGDIITKGSHLKTDNTGKTKAKYVTMDEMIHSALVVAGGIYSYAFSSGNTELETAFLLSERDFTHERLDEIPIKARVVLDKGNELATHLPDHGITSAELDKLRSDIEKVEVKTNEQGSGYLDKSSARTILTEDFEKADKILLVLDGLILKFAVTNPEFYTRYTLARIVKGKATGSRKKDNGVNKTQKTPAEDTVQHPAG